jgi:hypothetical protein
MNENSQDFSQDEGLIIRPSSSIVNQQKSNSSALTEILNRSLVHINVSGQVSHFNLIIQDPRQIIKSEMRLR